MKKMKKTFKIKGMSCNSCAQLIETELKEKVNQVSASFAKEQVEIDFDSEKISENKIKEIIKKLGYEIIDKDKPKEPEKVNQKDNAKKIRLYIVITIFAIGLILVLIPIYNKLQSLGLEVPALGENSSLFLLFFLGVLTGFHCISMCGAFVVSYTTSNLKRGHKGFKQHLLYGGSKVLSYAVIGGIFGFIGGIFAFSIKLRGTIAILAGTFMIFYALAMMGIGFFKRFQFNPKFLTKAAADASKQAKGYYKAPIITGILSGLFIACGPLQAMYLYATGTGSFLNGFTALSAFGLGTLPVMLGFGSLTTVISHKSTRKILKISAIIVLILGIIMLNRGLTVIGSSITYDSIKGNILGSENAESAVIVGGVQEINMEVNRYGWTPDSFVLQKGVPVRWNINVVELTGCNNEIIVNDYNLDIKLKKGLNVVEFTPEKTGTVRWSCWMGMIPGSFIITEDGQASQSQLNEAEAISDSGGSCGGSCGSASCGAASGGSCGCGG